MTFNSAKLGFVLVLGSLFLFFLIFKNALVEEFKYAINRPDRFKEVLLKSDTTSADVITPVDEDFGIVVTKIGANSKIIPNVDPYNSREYQQKLTRGVAHAKGTVFPGQVGNTFLFSHSSLDFYNVSKFNSVFYLLNKLKEDDFIYIFYQKEKFTYEVTETKIVEATDIKYLKDNPGGGNTLTLMTCWPAGTNLKRLVVIAKLID